MGHYYKKSIGFKAFSLLLMLSFSAFVQAQDTTKVLFIGNSITYFNNMPQTFEAIANSKGDLTEVTMYAPGGTGFVHHAVDPNVFSHFRQGDWDYVVLQPGSNESPGYSFPIAQTLPRAKTLKDSIIAYNPCAKILYYEISYGIWGNSVSDLATYNTTMGLIRDNLEYLADSTQLFFAPVGEAFRTAWNSDTTTILWGGYGDIHPNAKGSYIAACVFYATIFQKTSFGTTVLSSLSATEAGDYQRLADTTVLDSLSNWRINTYTQQTDFTHLVTGNDVAFTNLAQNFDSLSWDFGDNSQSPLLNPFHNYSAAGDYYVTLTTYLNGCAQTKTDTITIAVVSGLSNLAEGSNWGIYPNPTNDLLNIKVDQEQLEENYEIFDALGVLQLKTNNLPIDVSALPRGAYYLKVRTAEEQEVQIKPWVKMP